MVSFWSYINDAAGDLASDNRHVRVPRVLAQPRFKTVLYYIESRVPVLGSRKHHCLLLREGQTLVLTCIYTVSQKTPPTFLAVT